MNKQLNSNPKPNIRHDNRYTTTARHWIKACTKRASSAPHLNHNAAFVSCVFLL